MSKVVFAVACRIRARSPRRFFTAADRINDGGKRHGFF
ncbi:hypothetical protein ABIA39_000844 [Nocardia sp. GAS34]